jgi:hypothetical protein
MSIKKAHQYEKDYTEPKLREKLKNKIMQNDKGAAPGQWSARKAQLLKHEYEKAGGGYKHSEQKTKEQQSLHHWSKQH